MNDTEPHQRATAAALRFLSHRPRSKEEVRTRLRRSFPADVVDQVIDDLTERSLVDDSSFAKLWRDSRDSFNPRSATAIKRELISKGVAGDLAQRTVDDLDDMDSNTPAGWSGPTFRPTGEGCGAIFSAGVSAVRSHDRPSPASWTSVAEAAAALPVRTRTISLNTPASRIPGCWPRNTA